MKATTGVLIGLAAAGVGIWLLNKGNATNQEGNQVATTPDAQRQKIIDFVNAQAAGLSTEAKQYFATQINNMSDQEVNAVYTYLFDYLAKGVDVPDGDFKNNLTAIFEKYQIFT